MGSSGKKKTTMAKLARESRLRERRMIKQAKKDARKLGAADESDSLEAAATEGPAGGGGAAFGAEAHGTSDGAARAFRELDPEPVDPRIKEVALARLRGASDDELAVFGGDLRDDALAAGASEQEMRDAQRDHPGHEG